MPYIPQVDRLRLNSTLNDITELHRDCLLTKGELNYLISNICKIYLGSTTSYSKINDIVGALECSKIEFYRRVAEGYEDEKKNLNGDVY